MDFYTIGSTIRQTRAQHYNEKGTINLNENEHPILARLLNGRGWGDVYQLGMSLADSYLVGKIGKGFLNAAPKRKRSYPGRAGCGGERCQR